MSRMTIFAGCLSVAIIAGCGPENGSGPTLDASAKWTATMDLGADDGVVIGIGDPQTSEQARGGAPDSVTIESGALVIRSLRLESGSAAVDTNITAEDQNRDADDDLIQFKGPYVCAASTPASLGTQSIPSGQFDRVVFVLQPAANASQAGGREDLIGRSVLIRGRVWRDGRSDQFEFSSDYATECAVNRSGSVGAGQTVAGAIIFRTSRWFRTGSTWLDPNTAANRIVILRNIRSNVLAQTTVE